MTFYMDKQIKSNRIDNTLLILNDLFKTNKSLQEFYSKLTKKKIENTNSNILKFKIKKYLVKYFK
jgi:hypothetical protein